VSRRPQWGGILVTNDEEDIWEQLQKVGVENAVNNLWFYMQGITV